MFVVSVILIHGLFTVSQGVFTVEVNMSKTSVLLPCKIRYASEVSAVVWSRTDLSPSSVHKHVRTGDEGGKDQMKRFHGRTLMSNDALKTGDLSLTLKTLRISDSGTYVCTVRKDEEDKNVNEVQLQVKVNVPLHTDVKEYEGVESVQLPCLFHWPLTEDTTIVWSRNDLSPTTVHLHHHGEDLRDQNQLYSGRTSMKPDALNSGDLSLTLRNLQLSDSGKYTCTIREFELELKVKQVQLQVQEQVIKWNKVLLVLLVPVLFAIVVGLFYYFLSVQQVEVDSGVESVQLPCETTVRLSEDVRVEWGNSSYKVHVYENGSDQPGKQHIRYRGRTEMKRNLQKTGNLTLTLKYPTDRDRDTYTCTVYNKGNILMKKDVKLTVKVCQVEVEEGEESVLLPFRTTGDLPEDTRVEWKREEPVGWVMIHMFSYGSDQPDKDCSKMNEDLLKTGDLSLTLKHPTVKDTGRYFCILQSSEIFRNKMVVLTVKERIQDRSSSNDCLMGN